jgi:hypothetical protein
MYIRDLNFEFENLNQQRLSTLLKLPQRLYTKIGVTSSRSMSVSKKACPACFLRSSSKGKTGKLERREKGKHVRAFEEYYKQGEPRKSDHQTDLMQVCQI